MPPPSATPRLNISPQKRDQYEAASVASVASTVPRFSFRTLKVLSFVDTAGSVMHYVKYVEPDSRARRYRKVSASGETYHMRESGRITDYALASFVRMSVPAAWNMPPTPWAMLVRTFGS